jgi:spermidine/putrescine transport system substrate-binding protein
MVRPLHPKERQLYSRRAFLQRAAAAGIALPSLSAILAACGSGAQSSVETSGGATGGGGANPYGTGGIGGAAYPLARPDAPVTWNVDEANLIASDLPPEENATVKILRWPYYLAPAVIKSFEKKYNCTVEQTEFSDMDKGLAKINTGQGDFDLLVGMNVWALGRSIAAGLLRPINLDYIPNLAANCWDSFKSPFYDVDSHYSVPYSVWSTGIFWRNDKITEDIAAMANPYDIFWNGAPVDKTHLLSNAQDVLSMSMFRDGLTDVNVTDPATISTAKDAMADVVHTTNAAFDHVDYTDVPKGQAYLHQSWSGNVSDAFVFLPAGDQAENLSYVWPVESGVPGNVDNDTLVLLNTGKTPVLAHHLLNHILDATNAMTNFETWTGYQMPQKTMTREALVGSGLAPEHLANVYIVESDMNRGSRELELPAAADALWQAAYAELTAGV